MPTIALENKKILRKALDVVTGMDIPSVSVSSVSATGNYTGSSYTVGSYLQRPPVWMDLSNGGFQNDGEAEPYSGYSNGYVSTIGTNLVLSITLSSSSSANIVIIGYKDNMLTKWTFSGSGASRTITIPTDTKRIIVGRIVCGQSFWFDNSNLISCNLQLRSVETKVDNPELQMSEIEIEGYEPNDITNVIGRIGTGHPIYYRSGYPGDMSPVRKFYLGEQIEYEDKTIKIKGYDATYFLDNEFGGKCVNWTSPNTDGGLIRYVQEISTMLTNSNVSHSFVQDPAFDINLNHEGNFLIDKQPKRSVIAQAVNILRTTDGEQPMAVNYVDAGIPRLWTGIDTSNPKTLENISKPNIIIDPVVKSLTLYLYVLLVRSSATIETINAAGLAFHETSDPYYTFTANTGTITYVNPYKYKLDASGSVTISGRLIDAYAALTTWPVVVSSGTNGIDVDLGSNYAGMCADFRPYMTHMLTRSNISYEFEYRGDPNLQPRDYIRADIDGSGTLVDMTIDTIELRHEGGGTSSTIVARKGFI